jgi:hypothetical protein
LEAENFLSFTTPSIDEPMASYTGVGISYRGVRGVSGLEVGIGSRNRGGIRGVD